MADQYGYYGQDGYGVSGEGGQSAGSYTGSAPPHRGKEYQDQSYSSRDGDSKGRVSRFDPSYQKSRSNESEEYSRPSTSGGGHYDYKPQSDYHSEHKSRPRDRDDRYSSSSSSSSRDYHQEKPRYDDQSRPPRYNREDRGYQSGPKHSDFGSSQTTSPDLVVMEDTIFVSNLPKDVNEADLAEFFGSIGCIKFDKKTRKPKIYIYRDSDGTSKGEATITYDDTQAAPAAINWMNGKELRGSILKIEIATRKAPPGGFFARRGGRGGGRGRGGFDRSRDDDYGRGGQESNSFESPAVDYRHGGGFSAPRGRGGFAAGAGDWKCESCDNLNFARRFQCNRCQAPKPSSASTDEPGSSGGGYSKPKFSGHSSEQSYSKPHDDSRRSSGYGGSKGGRDSDSYGGGRQDHYSRGYGGGGSYGM